MDRRYYLYKGGREYDQIRGVAVKQKTIAAKKWLSGKLSLAEISISTGIPRTTIWRHAKKILAGEQTQNRRGPKRENK
jgi:hypothetical protein